jgi:hypothetical protein
MVLTIGGIFKCLAETFKITPQAIAKYEQEAINNLKANDASKSEFANLYYTTARHLTDINQKALALKYIQKAIDYFEEGEDIHIKSFKCRLLWSLKEKVKATNCINKLFKNKGKTKLKVTDPDEYLDMELIRMRANNILSITLLKSNEIKLFKEHGRYFELLFNDTLTYIYLKKYSKAYNILKKIKSQGLDYELTIIADILGILSDKKESIMCLKLFERNQKIFNHPSYNGAYLYDLCEEISKKRKDTKVLLRSYLKRIPKNESLNLRLLINSI